MRYVAAKTHWGIRRYGVDASGRLGEVSAREVRSQRAPSQEHVLEKTRQKALSGRCAIELRRHRDLSKGEMRRQMKPREQRRWSSTQEGCLVTQVSIYHTWQPQMAVPQIQERPDTCPTLVHFLITPQAAFGFLCASVKPSKVQFLFAYMRPADAPA